ncbi:uncharacterized protein E0L32_005096 [Thyridium curvatum]|uniref:Uncharacterized protein n=1 Tax=Thyridium curvatum TaxID=1093900 RepID=A0A507BCM5_9PEZI|nr:uncharacterized protein E0L32_005096 [Thyridium curvatum]TPX14701.1 hypothetical protein E0L32_005096 [Thyridium curvatum]
MPKRKIIHTEFSTQLRRPDSLGIAIRRRLVHGAPVDLQHRHQRQQQHEQRQQLPEAPVLLAPVPQRHRRRPERLAQDDDARRRADRDGRHQRRAHQLRGAVEPRPPLARGRAVQVPRRQREDDAVARDHGPRADVHEPRVGRRAAVVPGRAVVPDAGDGQRRRQVAPDALQDVGAVDGAEREVDEHEGLAQPAQDPVAAEVAHEDQQRRVVHRHGQQRQHPDEEEVVGHEGRRLGQPHALDADARHDLLVRVAAEQLAPDRVLRPAAAATTVALGFWQAVVVVLFRTCDQAVLDDERGAHDQHQAGCEDEGEKDLSIYHCQC